jgi:hypothetical protein
MRKFITEIVTPLEETLIDQIIQTARNKLNRKPDWTRSEVHDLLNEVIQEVQNERRRSSNELQKDREKNSDSRVRDIYSRSVKNHNE